MERRVGHACLVIACVCAGVSTLVSGADRKSLGRKAVLSKTPGTPATHLTTSQPFATAQALPMTVDGSPPLRAHDKGSVAGTPSGTTVYSNVIDPAISFYDPGSGQIMADDVTLASPPCELIYYDVGVFSTGSSSFTFTVSTALWDGNPCDASSSIIAGTEAIFTDVQALFEWTLSATLDAPVAIPNAVWLAATFSTDDSGWVIADEAETGFTGDFWAENDSILGCARVDFTNPDLYGGFRANLVCSEITDPPGACCDGAACTELTEVECAEAGASWQGAFVACDPNPCITGACCSGDDFTSCEDTTEARCAGGTRIFQADVTCDQSPCQPAFKVFENDFDTRQFEVIGEDTMWADDLVLGPGVPCELAAYNLTVSGEGGGPFDVHVELWTNDNRGTLLDEVDDLPLTPITGTAADFAGIPSDTTRHVLLANHFEGIVLPDRVWLVVNPGSDLAGPVLGGVADVGVSRDAFAIFNDPAAPGEWADNFWFGGFTPESCPGPTCLPAGSFHINVWCRGTPPTGACCSDVAGTCIDNVTLAQCGGRWADSATCDSAPFVPDCGTSACCWLGNCSEIPPEQCESLGGDVARGSFCANFQCPRAECSGATGDCLDPAGTGTPGCDDAFCCEVVCLFDPDCCNVEWDDICGGEAVDSCGQALVNDHCGDAEPITGEGDFSFDNSLATTDGPPHEKCGDGDEEQQIFGDVWHCWTATCTNTVYVRTCGLTTVDTKLAVYEGCDTCPPVGDNLLSCNDNFCGYEDQAVQSQASFNAVTGQDYLIRMGTPFETAGGPGVFNVACGLPDDPACPGPSDCCGIAGTPGCADELCCKTVCACDAFCCEVAWDDNCATMGVGGSGCGAELLCPSLCGEPCPEGVVTFLDPPNGVVDARQPHEPANASSRQGIDTIKVEAPAGADNPRCWTPCETVVEGPPNDIVGIVDQGDGTFTLSLLRPISAGGLTAITYTADSGATYTGTFIAHPANVNADGASDANDIVTMVNCCLNQECQAGSSPEETLYRCDINRSGQITPADMLRTIDLLNGGDQFRPWSDALLPTGNGDCP